MGWVRASQAIGVTAAPPAKLSDRDGLAPTSTWNGTLVRGPDGIDDEALALDEVDERSEQRRVKLVSGPHIERQRLVVRQTVGLEGPAGLAVGRPALALPVPPPLALAVEPAAQPPDTLAQRVGAERNADPARLPLGDGPRQRSSDSAAHARHVEEYDEGLILLEEARTPRKRERPGVGELGVLRKIWRSSRVSMAPRVRVNVGDGRAECIRRLGVGLPIAASRRLSSAWRRATKSCRSRTIAEQPPRALGEAHRHLRERIGGARLQRPLCQLEALLTRGRAVAAGAVMVRGAARRFQVLRANAAWVVLAS